MPRSGGDVLPSQGHPCRLRSLAQRGLHRCDCERVVKSEVRRASLNFVHQELDRNILTATPRGGDNCASDTRQVWSGLRAALPCPTHLAMSSIKSQEIRMCEIEDKEYRKRRTYTHAHDYRKNEEIEERGEKGEESQREI